MVLQTIAPMLEQEEEEEEERNLSRTYCYESGEIHVDHPQTSKITFQGSSYGSNDGYTDLKKTE